MHELSKSRAGSADGCLLRIRLLGRMDAETYNGASVLPIGSKTRALLAILALSDRKSVQRRVIADLLWSGVAPCSAMASLRQEVHRLRKTFEPSGIEPINVQRHTLALKPVLSCVDVERIMHGGVDTLPCLKSPDVRLLPDMTSVDPAFDKWLLIQREQVDRHISALFRKALGQESDPEMMLVYADGLLKRDAMNELAWRGRLRAFIEKGEWGEAARGCVDLLALYDEKLGARPGPETMQLVREIQSRFAPRADANFAYGQTFPYEATQHDSRPTSIHGGAESLDDTTRLFDPLNRIDRAQVLGRVAVGTFSAPAGLDLGSSVSALAEQLEVELVRLDTVQVVVRPSQEAGPAQHTPSRAPRDRADFRLEGFVCADSGLQADDRDREETRITVRLISCKDDDYLIWADRIRLPRSMAAIREFNRYVMWSLQWSLLLWEGTGSLNRPVTELSPPRLVARAIHLLTACDSTRWDEMHDLIQRAEARDGNNIIVLFVRAHFELAGFLSCWTPFGETDRRDLARHLERVGASMRYNPLGEHLIMFARLILPRDFDQAHALYFTDVAAVGDYRVPTLNCFHAWRALLGGKTEDALREVQEFENRKTILAITVVLEPVSALMLHGCGAHDRAHRMISAYLYVYPRCKLGLLVYMLGLLHLKADAEAADARERILRLAPETTVSGVSARLSYLPAQIREWSFRMLDRSTLPR